MYKYVILVLQVLPNGNLAFPAFRAEDYRQEVHAQVYVCLARNSVGSIHSRDVNVRAGNILSITIIMILNKCCDIILRNLEMKMKLKE